MAAFNIGDRVNFLSSVGGGKVTKIIDSRMVMVEVEDGFEIPTLITDLVPDFRSQPSRQQQIVDTVQQEIKEKEIVQQQQEEDARHGGLRRFAKEAEKEGVYLAFVPHEQQWLLTGALDVVLVNHTPYEMLYTFTIKEETQFVNVDYGQMEKHEKVVVETISREDLEYWCNGIVQAIFTTETADTVLLPLNAPFSLRSNRFFKEGSYLMSGLLGEKAVMICLSDLVALKSGDGDFSRIMKEGVGSQAPKKDLVKQEAPIDKHKTGQGEATVDLHIGELVDNILGLSSHDMFNIQMDYFRKMLESAIAAEYTKVTFIHGVGNGVLKNAIIEELKKYKNTENRMASIAKFGVGAIEVVIKEDRSKNMRRGHNRTKDVFGALLFVILIILFSSCHRVSDPLIGRWTVDKVNVDFDENKATPEMVRQLGELEKGNVIEIGKDSTLTFISDGDTLRGQCSLKGTQLFLDDKLFGQINDGALVRETSTPIGKMIVFYKKEH